MPYSYNKLRGRIVELFRTQGEFAKKLGVSENSVSKKMNCKTEFSQEEIIQWASLLNIGKEEYSDYFFT